MPDTDGVPAQGVGAARHVLTMPVIMMSGHATIDTAVEATRIGASPSWKSPSPCKSCSRRWSRAGTQPRAPAAPVAAAPAVMQASVDPNVRRRQPFRACGVTLARTHTTRAFD